ncbi:MAG: serine/threonine-protein kinase [Bryobacter sp.]|nr:serine/threonine-protein kinase [Bryobacter sp.]
MSPGGKLGSYQIVSALGAGGMGEVWRARDPRLNREVALKLVPAGFLSDEQRVARFEREAQVLASLNHPNIAAIYGLEESDGQRALVMELVEGPTLADRLQNGPLPLEEALPIARQIAEAVEYAHEKGIIHRDLKPANVKVTPEGTVKVLDFGLAKAMAGDTPVADPDNSPTLTIQSTQLGVILGTAGYMAPEQARGAAVDRRADVWGFGVVLWEMLTGRRMFAGESVSDILSAVLHSKIDFTALPAATPASIRKLLRRCLERDRRKRLPHMGAARLEIDEALQQPPESAPPAAQERIPWLPWAIAVLSLLAGGTLWLLRPQPVPIPVAQLELNAPAGTTLGPGIHWRYAVSPDGSKLAFVAISPEGRRQLYLRNLDQPESRLVPGSEDSGAPFWAPDSRWLAFSSRTRLIKLDTQSGQVTPICPINGIGAGTWNRDGVILFGDGTGPIKRVLAAGGEAAPALELDAGREESGHRDPYFLPDGRQFLYTCFGKMTGICLASLDSKQSRYLFRQWNSPAHYVQNHEGKGYLLFVREQKLLAQEFDAGKGTLQGPAKTLVEQVGEGQCWSSANNGILVTRRFSRSSTELVWYSREGKPAKITSEPGSFEMPRLSPDGKRVVFGQADVAGGNFDLWTLDLDRGTSTRITFDPGYDLAGIWSPDGRRIAYYSNRGGERFVVERSATGLGQEETPPSRIAAA